MIKPILLLVIVGSVLAGCGSSEPPPIKPSGVPMTADNTKKAKEAATPHVPAEPM